LIIWHGLTFLGHRVLSTITPLQNAFMISIYVIPRNTSFGYSQTS